MMNGNDKWLLLNDEVIIDIYDSAEEAIKNENEIEIENENVIENKTYWLSSERLLVVVHVCSSPRMPCTWKSTLVVLDSFFSVTVAFTQYDNENENENENESVNVER